MPSLLQQTEEPRYDAETLRRVTRLAQELQSRSQDTLTAGEIEAAGAEVGLEPRFIQEALAQVSQPKAAPTKTDLAVRRHWMRTARKAWWAGGWAFPLLLLMSMPRNDFTAGVWFASIALYIAIGVILGSLVKSPREILAEEVPPPGEGVSRTDFLEVLGALREVVHQRQEPQVHAALSVEVAGFLGFRHGPLPGAAEASLAAFRDWAGEIVRRHGGQLRRCEGFEINAHFEDEAAAVRTAQALQTSIAEFNREGNRLSEPFALRCAVAGGRVTGEAAESELGEDAERIRSLAEPGDILVNTETAAEAVVELGGVKAIARDADGERLFSWRAAHPD